MLRRVHNLDFPREAPRGFRVEGLVEGPRVMRVQIVAYQGDAFRVGVLPGDILDKNGEVVSCLALHHPPDPPSGEGLHGQKDVRRPFPEVFRVVAHHAVRSRVGRPAFPDELLGHLVHAEKGAAFVVGPAIEVEDILHGGHEGPALRRGDDPLLLQPRLDFVFFSMRDTVG